jgi:hypothetical protein
MSFACRAELKLLRIRSGLMAKTVVDPTLKRSSIDQALDDPATATDRHQWRGGQWPILRRMAGEIIRQAFCV